MRSTQFDTETPEMRALDMLRDEEYINDLQMYEDMGQRRTVILGRFGKFNEEMKFEVSFDDREFMEIRNQGRCDDLIIRDVINRVRSCVYNGCEKTVGELKGVPLEINEVGGYQLTCYVCGNSSRISTDNLRYCNVSRQEAFMACLAKLHDHPPDPWLDCRKLYIR